jgi:aryl-alcohol dehydrogenase-like predicted oxidoreductase
MRAVPKTDLVVSELCLGGNVFGWSADKDQSFSVLDAFAAKCGNFIDTADVYSEWKPGNVGGESETIIGSWLQAQDRDQFVIATKVAKLSTRPGLGGTNVIAACEDSLRRLGTDHIDIYYSHHFDGEVALEETLAAYEQLIAAGKVRYIAASQHSADQLRRAKAVAEENDLPQYIALQNEYNLIEREAFETDSMPILNEFGIGAFPFFALARGFLSGKYQPGTKIESVRAQGVEAYATKENFDLLQRLGSVAQEHGVSTAAVSLQWLRQRPSVIAPIASARTTEQLAEISQELTLGEQEIEFIKG